MPASFMRRAPAHGKDVLFLAPAAADSSCDMARQETPPLYGNHSEAQKHRRNDDSIPANVRVLESRGSAGVYASLICDTRLRSS